jgi:hypothetical protein
VIVAAERFAVARCIRCRHLALSPPSTTRRSFAVEYERHIVHLLRRKIRMIHVYLKDVHVSCMWVGLRCFWRKEKLLHTYPDKQNRDYSDHVMLAHGKPPFLTHTIYAGVHGGVTISTLPAMELNLVPSA